MSSSAHSTAREQDGARHHDRLFKALVALILALFAVALEVWLVFSQSYIGRFAPLFGGIAIITGVGILFAPLLRRRR
jgi:hypothetical protein